MNDNKLSIGLIRDKFNGLLAKISHYRALLFIVFVAGLYLILFLSIQSLSNTEPSSQAVDNQVKASHVVRIDPRVVKQLQSLQDNSVSVKALFNQSRSNPFQ